ncbi:TK protein kinase [Salpingoeca rosetta]|uniref:non-specific protein-tyrosine kinase n=1 Tax=Salpingoeca rosetta (strain ATCC 50818 / BSB-021) TaxID=946362 RepID=F2U130_SALR5|nr:TK protein kinase [Salpingoeca rosetta]EGD80604.1 TK protein kinase [Salpingoeca rosetta]|eukprot:XP_004997165.1 TK protein kinase [Salpingoeca rosetta]
MLHSANTASDQYEAQVDDTDDGVWHAGVIAGVLALVAATAALGTLCVSRSNRRGESRIVYEDSSHTTAMETNPAYDGPSRHASTVSSQQPSDPASRPPLPLPGQQGAAVAATTAEAAPSTSPPPPPTAAAPSQPPLVPAAKPTVRTRPTSDPSIPHLSNPHTHTQKPKPAQADVIPQAKRALPPTVTVRRSPANAARAPVPRSNTPQRPPSTRVSSSEPAAPEPPASTSSALPPRPTKRIPRANGMPPPSLTRGNNANATRREYMQPNGAAASNHHNHHGHSGAAGDARDDYNTLPPAPPPRKSEDAGMPAPPPRKRYANVEIDVGGSSTTDGDAQHHHHHQQLTSSSKVNVPDIEMDMKDKQVQRDKLTLIAELGKGFFGSVYLARYAPEQQRPMAVAVKAMHTDQDFDEKARRLFLLEAQIMAEFSHPNLLRLIGVTTTEEPWCIVTEVCEFGDLLSLLRACEHNSVIFSLDEKLLFLAQISLGMSYLASKQFIHRDLAARNCLVAGDGSVKIGDFGMSRLLQTQKEYYRPSDADDAMPIRWMAVESLTNMKFSTKSDVWSFGVVCYEVFSDGATPYGPMNLLVIQAEVESGHRLEQPSACPSNVYTLMRSMWADDPNARPSFHDVYNQLSTRYREERKRTVSARDLPRVIRRVLRGHLSDEDDPYKLFKKREAQAKQQQAVQRVASTADEDDDDDDGYKDLDGTQMEYVDAAKLPQDVPVPEEPKPQGYVFNSLSRPAAERMLLSQGRQEDIQGLFLLRPASNKRDLSLSAVQHDAVMHFRVQATKNRTYKIMGGVYSSPEDLVMRLRMSRKLGIPLGEYITKFNQVV